MGKSSRETIQLVKQTASSFGYEWTKFNDIFKEYEDNFLEYIAPVNKEFFKGKVVLDAGCGAGRHTYFAAKYKARKVIAFDLSKEAVESAKKNTIEMPNVKVLQGDIYNLPNTWEGKFDYIFCIGVLHHLPNPQEGFNRLVKLLKPDGTISIWVYGKKDNKMALYLYRPIGKVTTLLPHKLLYWLSFVLAILTQAINLFRMPLFKHYRRFPFKTKWNDIFDAFSAPSTRYYEIGEIEEWFKQANLKNSQVSYRTFNKTAKGIKGKGEK